MMLKFKKTLRILTLMLAMSSLVACQSNDSKDIGEANNKTGGNLVSAVLDGESTGKGGKFGVKVSLENSELKDIEVVENSESDYTAPVIKAMIEEMIEKNSTDIDTVSGATLTSSALKNSVKDALKKEKVDLMVKEVEKKEEKVEDVETDIVIIGAGGAGLTAAIEATNDGAKVIVVEKNAFMGGNTNYATGGMNAAGTKYQKENGIEDSAELHFKDTMKGGHDKNDPELLKEMTENAADTVYWLESIGADLKKIGRSGGQSQDRIHKGPNGMPIGTHLMTVFGNKTDELGIDVRLNTKAVELISDGNKVTGIKVVNKDGNTYNINSKAVVLTSGGFGASKELIQKYKPELVDFGTTNQPGATGDALVMVEKVKADIVDIQEIQTHPTVVPNVNELITEGVRGDGAVLINRKSERFINELETRDTVSKAILSQEGKSAFLVFDEQVVEEATAIKKYKEQGLLTEASTIKELAEKMKLDGDKLEATINEYNEFYSAEDDKKFGRRLMNVQLTKAPFYAVEVTPAIHHTMGGLKINTNSEVLNTSGQVIEGLFAAGEVTGGVHGGNRIGGNAVTDITVFGKIAGKNSAKFVK